MSRSAATKYRGAILNIDEYLRKHWNNGTRQTVYFKDIASDLAMNPNTASGAMHAISQMKNSGLKKIKPAGTYEWLMPQGYPEELKALKDTANQARANHQTRSGRAKPVTGIKDRVVSFFVENPNKVWTLNDVESEVTGSRQSIGNALRKLNKSGFLTKRPDAGTACYEYVTDVTASDESVRILTYGDPKSGKSFVEPQQNLTEELLEVKPESGEPKPTPNTLRETLERLRAQVGQVTKATSNMDLNTLYRFKQETRKNRIVLENVETGELGYWKPL